MIIKGMFFILSFFLFKSCSLDLFEPKIPKSIEGGNLLISLFDNVDARSIVPPVHMYIDYYLIEGQGPTGASFSESIDLWTALPHSITNFHQNNLAIGDWTITVSGINQDSEVIAREEQQTRIIYNTTTEMTFELVPLEGVGFLNVSFSWTEANIDDIQISATLMDGLGIGAISFPLTFTTITNSGTGTATLIETEWPSGYYFLSIEIFDNNNPVWRWHEEVRILAGNTASANWNTDILIPLNITLSSDMQNPANVEFFPPIFSCIEGEILSYIARVENLAMDLLTPSAYRWYLNNSLVDTSTEFHLSPDLVAGEYRLDLYVEVEGVISSRNQTITILPAP